MKGRARQRVGAVMVAIGLVPLVYAGLAVLIALHGTGASGSAGIGAVSIGISGPFGILLLPAAIVLLVIGMLLVMF